MALCDVHLLRRPIYTEDEYLYGVFMEGRIRRDERSFAAVDVSRC